MRILLVGNYEPDQQQSMTRYSQWLLGALKARGCTVLLMRPVPLFSRLAFGPLRTAAVIKYLGYLDKYLVFPRQLKTAAKQFDLVHICDHSNSMYLRAVSRAGVPAVITCHDVLAIRAARGEFAAVRTGWSGKLLQAWILRGLTRARNVICVSEKTRADLTRRTGETGARIKVILNPLNWKYKPQPEIPEALHARIGLAAGERYFLHVGGNQWYKNRSAVVGIFRELSIMPEYAMAKLVMVGKPLPGELKARIEGSELADQVISVVGSSNEELEGLYSHALALIFPSLEEGFGWPIAEAQACGCPVATTGQAPMTEVAGEAAIFFDPEDAAGAAKAIRDGLVDREALREAGLRDVGRFDEGKIVEEYRGFYAAVLAER